jgi:hypothetical protein
MPVLHDRPVPILPRRRAGFSASMRLLLFWVLLAGILAASVTLALAQNERRAAAREACGDDVRRLCRDVAPGGGRLVQCLRKHQADLSPACRSFMAGGR